MRGDAVGLREVLDGHDDAVDLRGARVLEAAAAGRGVVAGHVRHARRVHGEGRGDEGLREPLAASVRDAVAPQIVRGGPRDLDRDEGDRRRDRRRHRWKRRRGRVVVVVLREEVDARQEQPQQEAEEDDDEHARHREEAARDAARPRPRLGPARVAAVGAEAVVAEHAVARDLSRRRLLPRLRDFDDVDLEAVGVGFFGQRHGLVVGPLGPRRIVRLGFWRGAQEFGRADHAPAILVLGLLALEEGAVEEAVALPRHGGNPVTAAARRTAPRPAARRSPRL